MPTLLAKSHEVMGSDGCQEGCEAPALGVSTTKTCFVGFALFPEP